MMRTRLVNWIIIYLLAALAILFYCFLFEHLQHWTLLGVLLLFSHTPLPSLSQSFPFLFLSHLLCFLFCHLHFLTYLLSLSLTFPLLSLPHLSHLHLFSLSFILCHLYFLSHPLPFLSLSPFLAFTFSPSLLFSFLYCLLHLPFHSSSFSFFDLLSLFFPFPCYHFGLFLLPLSLYLSLSFLCIFSHIPPSFHHLSLSLI